MSIALILSVAIPLILVVIWAMMTYNRLIRQRNQLREGWSGIDVQLKRRRDLVPNLVAAVKAYQQHERGLLEDVTRHRSEAAAASSISEAAGPEKALGSDLGRLLMLAEAYPELKADAQFRELGANLVQIENDLQFARRYYNGSVRDLNNLVETFPNALIASAGGFKTADYFELESVAERLPPDLGKLLKTSNAGGEA
ncbi:MAG: LemA family protein [Verrucomicrobiales bacterium]|nr:LemA family protein [Verrucomicrobiales bacterium]